MKRRHFLNLTVGYGLVTPLVNSVSAQQPAKLDPPPSLLPTAVSEKGKWFMDEPTRIGWFTLRYSDAVLSAEKFVGQVADAEMNLLCVTVGGSFAFYPSKIPFHEWAPGITTGNDFIGNLTREARRKNIRIGARFDFSKQSTAAVKEHPEWFFTFSDGTHPVDASGRTPPCINGDFFRNQAVLIMQEVITLYQPSLIYLNNFGNNLGGQDLADPCQCRNCKAKFLQMTGKPLPKKMNDEVKVFLKHCTFDTGRLFFEAHQKLAPDTIFINADTTPTHGWHSETRMLMAPSQIWLYITSEAVNRQRTSYPRSVTCNNVTGYSSNSSRLVLMPAQETRLRLLQAIAHGSPPTYVSTGTLQQDDERDTSAAKEVFRWHARNQDLFGGTINAARVLLLVKPETSPRGRNLVNQQSLRGIYRILTEKHIPVVVSENPATLTGDPGKYDLIFVTPGAPAEGLENFVAKGGRVLYVGEEPTFAIPKKIKQHDLVRVAYAEIKNSAAFPGLHGLKYLAVSSPCPYQVIDIFSRAGVETMPFIEYPEEGNAALSFVPPMIENPAEVSQSDMIQTSIPAVLFRSYGKGRIGYLPWQLGALYDRLGLPAHADLLYDLAQQMLGEEMQIKTTAHSSVEMVLVFQEKSKRYLLHLINLSGQTQNNYMEAIQMGPIEISISGNFTEVITRNTNAVLDVTNKNGRTVFILPVLKEYEVIILKE